ncbi:MAG: hypothetical protein HRT72_08240 [Flavobacteriales bacterium]|nr:hypothetical protein [Flavobacteriales bacterium]
MKITSCIFLLLLSYQLIAQEKANYTLLNEINTTGNYISTDNLGSYFLIKENEMIRFQLSPKLTFKYSDVDLSSISSVDVTDPLKILVFHKDLSKIIRLDNTLSVTGNPILLDDLDLGQCILACTSFNNAIWLYDQLSFQLIRLDRSLNKINESNNISMILGYDITPNFMIENNNWLYINDPKHGILVFDIYGAYFKTIPILDLVRFQIINGNIYFYKDGSFSMYNPKTLNIENIVLPESEFHSVQIRQNRLYVLKDKSLRIYSFE